MIPVHLTLSVVVQLLRHDQLVMTPMDYSPPGCSLQWIFQTWILGWVAISFSRGSSWPRDQTHVWWHNFPITDKFHELMHTYSSSQKRLPCMRTRIYQTTRCSSDNDGCPTEAMLCPEKPFELVGSSFWGKGASEGNQYLVIRPLRSWGWNQSLGNR